MIPLKDDLPTRRTPVLTIALIVANIVIFVLGMQPVDVGGGQHVSQNDVWAFEYGLVPCEVTGECSLDQVEVPAGAYTPGTQPGSETVTVDIAEQPAPLTVLTSAFLHGGFLHLAFNMLSLWIFGNNIEDAMPKWLFALFYLASAAVAGLGQVFIDTSSDIPMIGASGAIAAMIGSYLVLYPRAQILTILPVLIAWFVRLPAWIVAGMWGITQLIASANDIFYPRPGGGVAYMAHLAGFLFGLVVIKLIAERNPIYQEMYDPLDRVDHQLFR